MRVIGFSGRESDAPHGIWGALAEQLGQKDLFKDYYSPLQAPGQSAWLNLLKGPPTLILLDELPPYFENAKAKSIGNSDLARVTTTALSNLLVALDKPELSNVCVVISDLKATYQGGSESINSALRDFQNETHRGAMQLTPVALNSDDIFHIRNNYNGEGQIRDTLKAKQKFTEDIDSETFRKKCEQRLFTQQVMDFAEVKRRSATNPQWQWHLPSALDSLKSKMLLEDAWRENGGLVDKGPFAPPVTTVRAQELKRDDTTGETMLRLVPVHADKVHYEIGSPATTGSALVPDLQKFTTTDLRLSFLAVDSTGQHQTGPATTWQSRITLKHRFFQQGSQRMCELLAAPPVPVYYTTDGSTPGTASGVYTDPFPVPGGTICVFATGEKDGIRSEMLRADVPRDNQPVAIDPTKPATWKRTHAFDTTRESYEFLAKLEKAGARILGTRVMVGSSPWAEFNTDASMALDRATLEKVLHPLREIVGAGEVQLSCDGLSFASGQDLLNWVADHKTELKEHEVSQVVTRNESED